jgi:hypothetical protein
MCQISHGLKELATNVLIQDRGSSLSMRADANTRRTDDDAIGDGFGIELTSLPRDESKQQLSHLSSEWIQVCVVFQYTTATVISTTRAPINTSSTITN